MSKTWNNPYPAPTKAGVTEGTLKVPTLIPQDWNLITQVPGRNRYIATSSNGYAELEIASSAVSSPYGNSKVAPNQAIIGLVGQSAYVRLRMFGTVTDPECTCKDDAVAPVSVSINVTIPSGIAISNSELQSIAGVALSALSNAVTSGTVVPLDNASDVALGAINLR